MDLADAWTFANLHTMSCCGDITFCKVYTHQPPHADKMEEENNEVLKNLPDGFSGRCYSGNADQDGMIAWDFTLQTDVVMPSGEIIAQSISPDSAVLEIGYTAFETTFMHLFQSRFLARWPYNSDYIVIMALTHGAFDKWHRRVFDGFSITGIDLEHQLSLFTI